MNDEIDVKVGDDWEKKFENLYQDIQRDKRLIEKEIKTLNKLHKELKERK